MNTVDRLTRRRSSRPVWWALLLLSAAGLWLALRADSSSAIASFAAVAGVSAVGAVLSLRAPLSIQWTRDPDPAVESLYEDLDRLRLENRRLRRQLESAANTRQDEEFHRLTAELADTRRELADARKESAVAPVEPGAPRDEELDELRDRLEQANAQLDELRASIDVGDVDPIALDEQVAALRIDVRKARADRALLREALQSSEQELQRAREAVRAYEADEPSDLDDRVRELQLALRRSEAERALLRSGRPESVWEARVGELERQLRGAEARAAALATAAGGREEVVSRLEQAESERLAAEDRANRAEQRAIGLEQRTRELSREVRTRLADAEESIRSATAGEIERLRGELAETAERLAESEARASAGPEPVADATVDPGVLAVLEERVREAERRAREAELRLHDILMTDEERAAAVASEKRRQLSRVSDRKRGAGADAGREALPPRSGPIADLQEAVAFELRGPVASLRGLALALRGAVETSDGRDLVRQLAISARKIDQLVADLGAVGKLADGTIRLRRRRADLTALVTRVLDEAEGFENRVLLLDGEPVSLSVDAGRIEQIVDSLLLNARARTTKGQTIHVHVAGTDDGGAVISVDDDSRTDPEIGPELSLAVRLVELHGGTLAVERRTKGASYRVTLPSGAARAAAQGMTSA